MSVQGAINTVRAEISAAQQAAASARAELQRERALRQELEHRVAAISGKTP